VARSTHRWLIKCGIALLLIAVSVVAPGSPPSTSASQTDCKSYAYDCTPDYTASNSAGSWMWTYYGGHWAETPTGYHNCTLYVAWRLARSGMGDPGGAWGNAVDWAGSIGGGNHTPSVGSIAWWGAEVGGGSGHVAYVEQVSGDNVFVRADNFSYTAGYTSAGWIAASSVDLFLHPHDVQMGSSIAAARNVDGRLEIFGTNSAGNIYHKWQTSPGGGWSAWYQIEGGLSSIAAETNADGRIEIFGVNSAGNIYHKWQTSPSGGWSAWYQIEGGLRP
jgi:surface antigen